MPVSVQVSMYCWEKVMSGLTPRSEVEGFGLAGQGRESEPVERCDVPALADHGGQRAGEEVGVVLRHVDPTQVRRPLFAFGGVVRCETDLHVGNCCASVSAGSTIAPWAIKTRSKPSDAGRSCWSTAAGSFSNSTDSTVMFGFASIACSAPSNQAFDQERSSAVPG